MYTEISRKTFDEERALYGHQSIRVSECRFDGPADGESAMKECRDVQAESCYFNLRYPLWHVRGLTLRRSEMTELCRAALWYTCDAEISGTKLHGIKALRECARIIIRDCSIRSPEFGWSVNTLDMADAEAEGEYFMLRSENLHFQNVRLTGKYSFQYVRNAVLENCVLDTKDAFWHAENVTIRNCLVRGEYLGWYSENLHLENCHISGTQPLCYCRGLRLTDCEMTDTDLAFEHSDVEARVTAPILSVKNPLSGHIYAPSVGEIILDEPFAKGQIIQLSKEDPS